MSDNKLIKIDSSIILKDSSSMNEYIKPMSRDILLFSTKIASTYKLENKAPLYNIKVGDRLFFVRGQSKYEDNLIVINNEAKEMVGYIPEQDSTIFARLMDAGKMLFAIVKNISLIHSFPLVDIDIYLQDF